MIEEMHALTKNPCFGTGHLPEREKKKLKKGPEEFLPGAQDPLAAALRREEIFYNQFNTIFYNGIKLISYRISAVNLGQ